MNDAISKYTGKEKNTIIEAMRKIDKNARGILYITDKNDKLVGCVTDGDIRRWILKTTNLDANCSDFMNRKPYSISEEKKEEAIDYMKKISIQSVPILDRNNRIVDILFLQKKYNNVRKNGLEKTPIIVMAGGKGTRLYPYTKILPKPLVPVGDIPILERIFNRFYQYGAKEFYLTVNYKKEMIKSYFVESNPPYCIHYIEESDPLGTAGSIRLINDKFKNPVLISNCDILIDVDYEKLIIHHIKEKNDMTIVSSLKNTEIPYGVIHTREQGIITSIEEKPVYSNFINTGMYVVNPEFLEWIPENKVFHMTELVQLLIENGEKVGIYPVSENSFLDMGQFEELKRMEEQISSGYVK